MVEEEEVVEEEEEHLDVNNLWIGKRNGESDGEDLQEEEERET